MIWPAPFSVGPAPEALGLVFCSLSTGAQLDFHRHIFCPSKYSLQLLICLRATVSLRQQVPGWSPCFHLVSVTFVSSKQGARFWCDFFCVFSCGLLQELVLVSFLSHRIKRLEYSWFKSHFCVDFPNAPTRCSVKCL
jgi:hypothetical protein